LLHALAMLGAGRGARSVRACPDWMVFSIDGSVDPAGKQVVPVGVSASVKQGLAP